MNAVIIATMVTNYSYEGLILAAKKRLEYYVLSQRMADAKRKPKYDNTISTPMCTLAQVDTSFCWLQKLCFTSGIRFVK